MPRPSESYTRDRRVRGDFCEVISPSAPRPDDRETFEPEIVAPATSSYEAPMGSQSSIETLQLRPETLFIMITAYATVESAVAAFQRLTLHDYLMKPVLFEDLTTRIDCLILPAPASQGRTRR